MRKKDKGISLPSPHNPADIHFDYLKLFQHVLTRSNSLGFPHILGHYHSCHPGIDRRQELKELPHREVYTCVISDTIIRDQ